MPENARPEGSDEISGASGADTGDLEHVTGDELVVDGSTIELVEVFPNVVAVFGQCHRRVWKGGRFDRIDGAKHHMIALPAHEGSVHEEGEAGIHANIRLSVTEKNCGETFHYGSPRHNIGSRCVSPRHSIRVVT